MSQFSGQSLNNGDRRFMIEWNNAISRHNLAKKMAEFLRKDLWCNWPFVSLDDKTMASLKIFEIIGKPFAFLNIFFICSFYSYIFFLVVLWLSNVARRGLFDKAALLKGWFRWLMTALYTTCWLRIF